MHQKNLVNYEKNLDNSRCYVSMNSQSLDCSHIVVQVG